MSPNTTPGPAPIRAAVDSRNKYYKDESVLRIMEALMIAIDGEALQDSANALQYVLNMVHTQANDASKK